MRICILSNALAVHTQRWAAAYAERGHDVHVLSIRRSDIPNVTIHTVCVGPVNSTSRLWIFLSYLWLLIRCRVHLKRIRPDILNAHYAITHGVIGRFSGFHPFAISLWGADVIWDGRGAMPYFRQLMLRFAFSKANIVCSTSQFMLDATRPYIPAAVPTRVVSFGIDCALFAPRDAAGPVAREDGLRIGFTKKLMRKYGPDELIKAMPEILGEFPAAKLVMAGAGPMEGMLRELVARLGLESRVEFLGSVPHAKIADLMRSFDVFVQPSVFDSESFGVATLEASACGVPVVATRVGGVPEVVEEGVTGFLVEPRNPAALAAGVLALLRDPELRRRMGAAGRRFVLERYEWSRDVSTMLEIFEELRSRAK